MQAFADLAAADLVYSSDAEPGIRRRGAKRFRYVDEATGSPVRHRPTLARIDALAVPPAWQHVWICADPAGHLQATGRDDRRRKQYRYHPGYRARREQEKFADLIPFGEALGPLRQALNADLDGRGWTQERVTALVLRLLDRTLIRVGNESYARENRTFGLTTLRCRHLANGSNGVALRFTGKGNKELEVPIVDRRLAVMVRGCSQLPGQLLFQWLDEDGVQRPVRSGDVNERLRALTGLDITAKTFRTWGASVRAAQLLAAEVVPPSERATARIVNEAVEEVAEQLGNTRAVARASYVHPAVVRAFETDRLRDWWRDGPTRSAGGLEPDERKLLSVLRKARRARLLD